MKYNPQKHHRRSIRLKGYDYSQAGLYFITICCNGRGNPAWLPFGKIENGQMILNDAGRMVEKWYYELENKYPDKRCHEMVVMPNHFHCIIENIPSDITTMGAHRCGVIITTNVGDTITNMAWTIKNTTPPLAMQWIGLKP